MTDSTKLGASQIRAFPKEPTGGGVSLHLLRKRATAMRNNPTEPEKRLWSALRKSQVAGFKFRRQRVIGRRIVDFYCPRAKLAVEVDGDTHDPLCDTKRDESLLQDYGVQTLRFTNEDVMRNLDGVLNQLIDCLGASNHPPTPSFAMEGESASKAPSSLEEGVGGGARP